VRREGKNRPSAKKKERENARDCGREEERAKARKREKGTEKHSSSCLGVLK